MKRIKEILGFRQNDLRLIFENIENQHNASAMLRTCDSVGILDIDVILPESGTFSTTPSITTGAEKWLRINFYNSTEACIGTLKSNGFKIACTYNEKNSLKPWEVNFCQKIAIIFGNEKEGVSEEARSLSDFRIWIPMFGMVRSLNVSVSAGMILYEALRQRFLKGYYGSERLREDEFKELLRLWSGEN
ncbi:MAG: TrmH family RNA methyltransferase [Candidatus Aminicenantia bacterium]